MPTRRVSAVAYGACRQISKAAAIALCLSVPANAEELTIAALGDSLTQGFGLPAEDGFVPQLERWLTERGHDVKVLNAGVSGDTTAGGLSRVAWTLGDGEIDGMIVALGGNDLLRGIDPNVSRANLDGILQAAQSADVPVLLAGLDAPGNYGPDYAVAFNAIYPELAAEYGAIYVESFLGGLQNALSEGAAPGELIQADGLHPSASGVSAIVEAIGPAVERLLSRAGG